jgi:hypothetical protein
VAIVLSAAGVMSKAHEMSLCLLNIKDVTPTTSIGNSPWNKAENYWCSGIIINKVCNYFEKCL